MSDPEQSNPRNPFGFDAAGPSADRVRRVYVRVNDRVQTLRAQPSWLQKLLGYTLLFTVLGLAIVFAILALIVGAVVAVAVLIALAIRKLIQLVTGANTHPHHTPGRSSNIRVIHRR